MNPKGDELTEEKPKPEKPRGKPEIDCRSIDKRYFYEADGSQITKKKNGTSKKRFEKREQFR